LIPTTVNNMKKTYLIGLIGLVFVCSCGKKKSAIREHINLPENGYIQDIKTDLYTLSFQYQPPAYRADQEIMLNKSTVNRNELIKEYDQLQQFLVKYKMENPGTEVDEMGMMDRFNLVLGDTIPCIDAHVIPYSPGSPFHEILLLFPLSEKELGNEFVLAVNRFPQVDNYHQIEYHLNKKD
jgi:hypothetical protein